MKSKKGLYKEVESTIIKNYSYEVPQVVAYDIVDGPKDYLDWVRDETM